MANPLNPRKQTVDLAAPGVRPSRIRRDPPAKVKEIALPDRPERDKWVVLLGVIAFAIGLVAVMVAAGSTAGWSPRDHELHFRMD